MASKKIKIGSRQSPLALAQANIVKARILDADGGACVEICPFTTRGDKILDRPIYKIGDKGLFTKELEDALQMGSIDIAVHSLKDLPTELPANIKIIAFGEREEPRDALVSLRSGTISELPMKARVGTSSLRRMSQLRRMRPDLEIVQQRGNVGTRLQKLSSDEGLDAIVLAACGLMRLGLADRITQLMSIDMMIPAPGQGVLAIEGRTDREDLLSILSRFHSEASRLAVQAERTFLEKIGGGCQVPVGAYAICDNGALSLRAYIGSLDGRRYICSGANGDAEDAQAIGSNLALEFIKQGAHEIIEEIKS